MASSPTSTEVAPRYSRASSSHSPRPAVVEIFVAGRSLRGDGPRQARTEQVRVEILGRECRDLFGEERCRRPAEPGGDLVPDRELIGQPLSHRDHHGSSPQTIDQLRVDRSQSDAPVAPLVRQFRFDTALQAASHRGAHIDHPVGVVAHVRRVDEAATAGIDEPVVLAVNEPLGIATRAHLCHAAVVDVQADVLAIHDIADGVARDRQWAEPDAQLCAEGTARPQILAYGHLRDFAGVHVAKEPLRAARRE